MKCEIEFLPVGTGSKPGDAIVVRYGEPHAYELMIVDGGTLESGDALVSHMRTHFPGQAISHVVLTHPDADHASGLRTVLEQLRVANLWLHVPWLHAAATRPYFQNKSWTDAGLSATIRKEYDIVGDVFDAAAARGVQIFEPFAGSAVGPFAVLSPHRGCTTCFCHSSTGRLSRINPRSRPSVSGFKSSSGPRRSAGSSKGWSRRCRSGSRRAGTRSGCGTGYHEREQRIERGALWGF